MRMRHGINSATFAACALAYAVMALVHPQWCAADDLAVYRVEHEVSGTIRVWGSPADRRLIEHLEAGFQKIQPGIGFSTTLHGPESTFAGVYTGVADLAFMAREMRVPMESMAFEWVHRYKAFEVEIANAGLGTDRPGVNLAVFVHKSNPLARLTLKQLDGILGAETRHGRADIRKWGELIADSGWQGLPIHVYGPALDSIPALFIRGSVLGGSRKWNPDYQEGTGWSEVLASLAHDPVGIAYAPAVPGNEGVKPIEVAAEEGGPFYALTAQTVVARSYPLTRVITAAVDRVPGKPIDPKVKEFLCYILSRDGQAAVSGDAAYIPLSAQSARLQTRRLD
jgi:phosphate transport system substrate-binding protein